MFFGLNYKTLPIILTTALFLIVHFPTFAAQPPILIDPADNTKTPDTSPKLSWSYTGECPKSQSCFLVDLSKSTDFSTNDKDNKYTNSFSYTPQLSEGIWFWRVKAKDASGSWSAFSEIRNFIITDQIIATPIPTPFLTQPKTSLNPPATTQPKASSFLISTTLSKINSSDQISFNIQLKSQQPNSKYFLKGAFFKNDSTNYFGKTLVSDKLVKNNESYSRQLPLTTDNQGDWSGILTTIPDTEDNGFSGSGSYNFKVGRYTSSGSGPTWSNQLTITINELKPVSSSVLGTKFSLNQTPSTIPPLPKVQPTSAATNTSSLPNLKSLPTTNSANQTNNPNTKIKGETHPNFLFITLGFISLSVGLVSLVFILKRR